MRVRAAVLLLLAAPLAAQEHVDFRRDVLPILEKRCVSCHRAPAPDARGQMRQPKAGLRLDGRGWIERGGDDDVVLVPGAPDDSLLYELVALPPDDDMRMPARGEPLSQEQQEIVRRWIAEGAEFGDWVGEPGPMGDGAAAVKAKAEVRETRADRLRALAKGLTAPVASALERARAAHARVEPIEDGSPLVSVSFLGEEEQVNAASLRALQPFADRIVDLSLGATGIDDDALRVVAGMKRLVTLRVYETAVGDRGLRWLRDLPELRVLDLHGTKVTDAGVDELAACRGLERVYLWGSAVTGAGVARLQEALPRCRVSYELKLPE